MSLLEGLNDTQREAAATLNGPVLVLAGAGTGKTRVITYRIANMLENHIKAENILAVTFTNKAAKEMQERIGTLISEEDAKAVTIGTFHSFCVRVLHQDITKIGFTRNFTIAIQGDQKGIVKQALAELCYHRDDIDCDKVAQDISNYKNSLINPTEAKMEAVNNIEVKSANIYERYQQILKNQNMLDFDDLLYYVIKLWEECPEVLKKYQELYRYILVDEYQDTNGVQFRMLELLTKTNQNICVVGDDDQSIYGWRGAVVDYILNFQDYFKNAKVVKLEQNYRSTNNILLAANNVISVNKNRHSKALWSAKGAGADIAIIRNNNAEAEALFVVDAILEERFGYKTSYDNFAILYRSNHLSRILEMELKKARIPYKIVGGQSFYQRKEIIDAIAYLKLIVNYKDDQSLFRILNVPPRGIGDKSIETLKEIQLTDKRPFYELIQTEEFLLKISSKARKETENFIATIEKYKDIFFTEDNLSQTVNDYLSDVGYLNGILKIYKKREESEKRQENIYELINSVDYYERHNSDISLINFLEKFSLMDQNDKEEGEDGESVTLMTVHASKGLEYPFVFVVGLEKGLFPHFRSVEENSEDEERRLFYVAITRAQENLVISFAMERNKYGKNERQIPSHFLDDIPEELGTVMLADQYFTPPTDEDLGAEMDKIIAKFGS